MKKNTYEELSNEKLLKKRDLFKGVLIGFGVIFLLAIGIIVYILSVKGLKMFLSQHLFQFSHCLLFLCQYSSI